MEGVEGTFGSPCMYVCMYFRLFEILRFLSSYIFLTLQDILTNFFAFCRILLELLFCEKKLKFEALDFEGRGSKVGEGQMLSTG